MTAKFKPPEPEQAPKSEPVTPYMRWYIETRSRLDAFLCSDEDLAINQERVAVRRSYLERFEGLALSYDDIKQLAARYGRDLTPTQAKAMRERMDMLRGERDAIADRLGCTDWPELRAMVLRDRKTLTELAGMRWIQSMPVPMPKRKPTDHAGMAERERLAEETARKL